MIGLGWVSLITDTQYSGLSWLGEFCFMAGSLMLVLGIFSVLAFLETLDPIYILCNLGKASIVFLWVLLLIARFKGSLSEVASVGLGLTVLVLTVLFFMKNKIVDKTTRS